MASKRKKKANHAHDGACCSACALNKPCESGCEAKDANPRKMKSFTYREDADAFADRLDLTGRGKNISVRRVGQQWQVGWTEEEKNRNPNTQKLKNKLLR